MPRHDLKMDVKGKRIKINKIEKKKGVDEKKKIRDERIMETLKNMMF